MKRIVAIMFVVVFFLVPATSWSKTELEARVAQLEALVATLQTQLTAETNARIAKDAVTLSDAIANAKVYTDAELLGLNTFVTGLENYVAVDTTNNRITFTGVNVQLVNGTGNTGTVNGKGNLIIGYDTAVVSPPSVKTGSHNLVIGNGHTYSSSGGFVAGYENRITSVAATVSGGFSNTASGTGSSVSGGYYNTASGDESSVSGGYGNTASGTGSSVSGGNENTASGFYSTVSGGTNNKAIGQRSTVSGGNSNEVTTNGGYAP